MLHGKYLRGWVAITAVAVSLAAARPASAGFAPNTGTATNTASTTTFTYVLSFDPSAPGGTAQLTSGSFITLYDFSPLLVPASTVNVPAGITDSIQFTGVNPSFGALPPDSSTIENITFLYGGTTLTTPTNFTVQITLPGQFTLGTQANASFASLTQYTADSGGVGQIETTSTYNAPVAVATAVPLPSAASAGLIGFGAFMARSLIRRWQRRHGAGRSAA